MHRDMDIIRKIVLAVRDAQAEYVNSVEGLPQEDFAFHAQLLEEAGLVAAAIQGEGKRIARVAVIYRLTWAGQDFADSIRDDTLWSKAKKTILKPSASWTFGILLEYLKFEIKRTVPGLDQIP
ncbi:DUF2513 domain-containing protein [Candidatus Accumulibacter phosphatis]|uniref:DUF2513 domain-containing protein n=2 Tax=Candidatus Accumulibacter contiguus TaxID=2954381 RepID=A0ABX1T903_9PROT|nr:DUF2513 domain-containing protein [Candidatus Accumulibacter contiguus]